MATKNAFVTAGSKKLAEISAKMIDFQAQYLLFCTAARGKFGITEKQLVSPQSPHWNRMPRIKNKHTKCKNVMTSGKSLLSVQLYGLSRDSQRNVWLLISAISQAVYFCSMRTYFC